MKATLNSNNTLNLEYDNTMISASSSDYKKVLQNRRKTDESFNKIKVEPNYAVESTASTDASALEETLSKL